jgi:ankyrin repeat protein
MAAKHLSLLDAIEAGDVGAVKAALDGREDLDAPDSAYEATALQLAASGGDPEIVGVLLEAGADPDRGFLESPLFAAAAGKKPALVRLLLKAGADVKAQDGLKRRALHFAAGLGRGGRSVLESGAEVDARDGRTPPVIRAARPGARSPSRGC